MVPLKGATKAKVQMPQQTEDNGEEDKGVEIQKQKRARRNHLIKAQTTRLPARASRLNWTTKYQFLVGRD